jgi:hypothetical protein
MDRAGPARSLAAQPGGTIGVTTGELSRYTAFPMSLFQLRSPDPTHIVWIRGVNVVGACNQIVHTLLEEPGRGEWLWLIGDDHAFAPDVLERLLAWDVDIVAPLCLRRTPPYHTVIATAPDADGQRHVVQLKHLTSVGLYPVSSVGSAGMLIRKHVFQKLEPPWFVYGKTAPDQMGEDLWFCERAREAGFPVYVDLDTAIGHIHPTVVTPRRVGDTWHVELGLGGGQGLLVRMAESADDTPSPIHELEHG